MTRSNLGRKEIHQRLQRCISRTVKGKEHCQNEICHLARATISYLFGFVDHFFRDINIEAFKTEDAVSSVDAETSLGRKSVTPAGRNCPQIMT